MPNILTLGDMTLGHNGFPPVPIISCSSDCFSNGKGIARVGDKVQGHSNGKSYHGPSEIINGSPTLFINGIPAAVGLISKTSCGDTLGPGSGLVTTE